jgi:hypothetical protein
MGYVSPLEIFSQPLYLELLSNPHLTQGDLSIHHLAQP